MTRDQLWAIKPRPIHLSQGVELHQACLMSARSCKRRINSLRRVYDCDRRQTAREITSLINVCKPKNISK